MSNAVPRSTLTTIILSIERYHNPSRHCPLFLSQITATMSTIFLFTGIFIGIASLGFYVYHFSRHSASGIVPPSVFYTDDLQREIYK